MTNIETFELAINTLQEEYDFMFAPAENGQARYSGPTADYAALRISAQIKLLERALASLLNGVDPEVYAGELELATVIADAPTTEIITESNGV